MWVCVCMRDESDGNEHSKGEGGIIYVYCGPFLQSQAKNHFLSTVVQSCSFASSCPILSLSIAPPSDHRLST